IHGVAMGGMHAVRRVEVSVDGGERWTEARLVGPDLGRYAWRHFVLPARLSPGEHVLACRATDVDGNVQVETTPENTSGYLNSGWRAHALRITVV
ncbi:MAG TPA: sulfite oxidase, partial [Burkholderiaceae bacterium]|nr:sulfite oxidase [Burkholderiaceae bacterium]